MKPNPRRRSRPRSKKSPREPSRMCRSDPTRNRRSRSRTMRRLIFCSLIACAAPAALAVNTSHWVHTSEADFKKGTFRNVVATNLGDLKLSRAVKMILEQDAKVSAVYCLTEGPDGAIYAGTGPHGVLLRVKDDKVTPIYQPEGI